MVMDGAKHESENDFRFFEYPDLSSSSTAAIRLVQIHPIIQGHDRECPIACTLIEANLDEGPEYDALSYTWGPPADYMPLGLPCPYLICNNQIIPITDNLNAALHQLRDGKNDRALWVDAICINQLNISERNIQVNMMQRIYGSAKTVIAWLGILDGDTVAAMKRIELLKLEDNHDVNSQSSKALVTFDFLVIATLFHRTWFRRAWIIQEMVLAREIVVFCGSVEIAWFKLHILVKALMEFRRQNYHMRMTRTLGGRLDLSYLDQVPHIFDARVRFQKGQRLDLITWLWLTRNHGAMDPRDKIFSLLSVAQRIYGLSDAFLQHGEIPKMELTAKILPALNGLEADYNKNATQVYIEISKYLLCGDLGQNILSMVEDRPWPHSFNIPSWVPDFSVPLSPSPLVPSVMSFHRNMHHTKIFEAAKACPPVTPSVDDCDQSLVIHGMIWDTLEECGESFDDLEELESVTLTLQLLASAGTVYHTGEDVVDVFWRTLIADKSGMESPAPTTLKHSFTRWLMNHCIKIRDNTARKLNQNDNRKEAVTFEQSSAVASLITTKHSTPGLMLMAAFEAAVDAIEVVHGARFPLKTLLAQYQTSVSKEDWETLELHRVEAYNFRIALANTYEHRRVFRTSNNYLGIGPKSVVPGDVVVVIPGTNVPYIFRNVDSAARLRLVGEAYAHGIMFGELNQDLQASLQSLVIV